jgi:hypothetical protein
MASKLNISHFNKLIDEYKFDVFFMEIEKDIPSAQQHTFNKLKGEFVDGNTGANFHQRLETFILSFTNYKRILNILIITCNKSQVEHSVSKLKEGCKVQKEKKSWLDFEQNEISSRYGNEMTDWKPYKEETIMELLDTFKRKFNVEIVYKFLAFRDENEARNYKWSINEQEENFVFIGDIWALHPIHDKHNTKVAKSFDNKKIGGCIIPVCEKLDFFIQNHIKNITRSLFDDILCRCFYHYFDCGEHEDIGYVYIDLEVPNKHSLFRKLHHILNFNPPCPKTDFQELIALFPQQPHISL